MKTINFKSDAILTFNDMFVVCFFLLTLILCAFLVKSFSKKNTNKSSDNILKEYEFKVLDKATRVIRIKIDVEFFYFLETSQGLIQINAGDALRKSQENEVGYLKREFNEE